MEEAENAATPPPWMPAVLPFIVLLDTAMEEDENAATPPPWVPAVFPFIALLDTARELADDNHIAPARSAPTFSLTDEPRPMEMEDDTAEIPAPLKAAFLSMTEPWGVCFIV